MKQMALTQLYSYGCSDTWYMTIDSKNALPYNINQYNECYHIDTENGCMTHVNADSGIQHDACIKLPYKVTQEKQLFNTARVCILQNGKQ